MPALSETTATRSRSRSSTGEGQDPDEQQQTSDPESQRLASARGRQPDAGGANDDDEGDQGGGQHNDGIDPDLRQAYIEEGEQRAARRFEDEQAQRERERQQADRKARATNHFTNAQADATGILAGFQKPDGNGGFRPLTEAEVRAALSPLNNYHRNAEETYHASFDSQLIDQLVRLAPADSRPGLKTKLQDAEDYAAVGTLLAEALATKTKVVSEMGLDEIVQLSPKAKREFLERGNKIKVEARKEGRLDPDREQRGATGDSPRTKTYSELEYGYGAGTNSESEDAAYLKQRAERAP